MARAGFTGTTLFQVTVVGHDRPGIAAALFAGLAPLDVTVRDVEQVRVHDRLVLSVEVAVGVGSDGPGLQAVAERAVGTEGDGRLVVTVSELDPQVRPGGSARDAGHVVTVLAPRLSAVALAAVCRQVTASGANIERIVRLASYPVTSYELTVSDGDPGRLRRELAAEAARLGVDVAVQRAGLHRRAKHLIVLDADSTLLQGEVLDLLAERAGCGPAVAELTAAAMAGKVDFGEALTRRLALLAGTDEHELDTLAAELRPAPGARTLIRTLTRLGYTTAVVSGGFTRVIRPLADRLGIEHVEANTLEVADGLLTGRLVGPTVDRAGKAAALVRLAAAAGVPLSRTIAVGDGANDLDMLAVAGLGIAYNAKPAVRDAADTALSVPYLDAILFLLGISREEVEAADKEG